MGRALGPDSLWGKVARRLLSGRGVSGEKRRWKDSRQRGEREGGGAWRGGKKLEGPERQPVFNLSWGGRASLLFLGYERFSGSAFQGTGVEGGLACDESPRVPCCELELGLRYC